MALFLAVVIAIFGYPLASGPAVYAVRREWTPDPTYMSLFGPVEPLMARTPL